MRTKVVGLYIFFVLGIFPLLMHNGFVDITKTKSDIFLVATIILLIFCWMLCVTGDDWKWIAEKKNRLIYLAAFVIGITTMHAWNFQYALTGEAGRHHGALIYWAYCIAALCIINFGRFEKAFLDVAVGTGTLTAIIAIFNFYEVDILGTLSGIVARQHHIFISTIGNINIYAAFLSVVTPLAVVKAVSESDLRKRILYYFSTVSMFGAMMACLSDSVYLTLFVLVVFLPFYCFPHEDKRIRMMIILVLFTLILLGMNLLNHVLEYPLAYIDGILKHFSDTKLCIILFVISIILLMFCIILKKPARIIKEQWWRIGWVCVAFCITLIAAVLYVKHTEFNYEWGSYRGATWMQGWEFYIKQDILTKCLGVGLDSIYPVFNEFFGYEAFVANKLQVYDNLHNEYLQYLITTGMIGLGTYLLVMGKMLHKLFSKAGKNENALAIALAGMCYLVQAIVNINMSSVTAIIMILLCAGQVIEN